MDINIIALLFVLIGTIILTRYALKSERADLFCGVGNMSYDPNKCGDGKGKTYAPARITPTDSTNVVLEKIKWLAKYKDRTIIWRRFLITGVLALIIIILLTPQLWNTKSANIYFTIILGVFMASLFVNNYYAFHYDQFPAAFIDEGITHIRKKYNAPNLEGLFPVDYR